MTLGKRLTLNLYFSTCTKIYSEWIKGLNIRPETTTEKTLENIGLKIWD
jgi:hypothetical protein